MEENGITGYVLRWVRSWLTNRLQREVVNSVPQGSILGPLLFVIFMTDIDGAVEWVDIIRKLADDTKISQKITTMRDREKLQEMLDNLDRWAKSWGMEFNLSK
jgi:ribonuclease P/MRP protein subunit RPP40